MGLGRVIRIVPAREEQISEKISDSGAFFFFFPGIQASLRSMYTHSSLDIPLPGAILLAR